MTEIQKYVGRPPKVNLGQSQFQDLFFVALQQSTPFRRLRQLELELDQINRAIRKAEFEEKKARVKIKLAKEKGDELSLIEAEEMEWELKAGTQLVKDAKARYKFFKDLKRQLLNEVPKEYWDQGFEKAEAEYWVNYLTKQLIVTQLTGIPNTQVIDQLIALPEDLQKVVQENTQKQLIKYLPPQKPSDMVRLPEGAEIELGYPEASPANMKKN